MVYNSNTIYIQQYRGMAADRATRETYRYRILIVGTEGSVKEVSSREGFDLNYGYGLGLDDAERMAAEWSRILGWKIVRQKEVLITRIELHGVDAFKEPRL